jgi:hypothetical protein
MAFDDFENQICQFFCKPPHMQVCTFYQAMVKIIKLKQQSEERRLIKMVIHLDSKEAGQQNKHSPGVVLLEINRQGLFF